MKDWINVALPKGRLGEKAYAMLKNSGYECPAIEDPGRKLIFENPEKMVRYFWVKPSDVAIYVERGAADLGWQYKVSVSDLRTHWFRPVLSWYHSHQGKP